MGRSSAVRVLCHISNWDQVSFQLYLHLQKLLIKLFRPIFQMIPVFDDSYLIYAMILSYKDFQFGNNLQFYSNNFKTNARPCNSFCQQKSLMWVGALANHNPAKISTPQPSKTYQSPSRQTESPDNSMLHMFHNNTYTDFRTAYKQVIIPSYIEWFNKTKMSQN